MEYKLEKINIIDIEKDDITSNTIFFQNYHMGFKLTIAEKYYYFFVQSDIVEPTLQVSENKKFILLGTDHSIVFFNRSHGNILFNIGLGDYFQYFIDLDSEIIIVSQSNVIQVSSKDLSLQTTSFPDIITDLQIDDNQLIIHCMDNSSYPLLRYVPQFRVE